MITKWKVIDPLKNNMTTFRFWTDSEDNDLDLANYLIGKYLLGMGLGYKINGLIKIKMEDDNVFYEIITSLPFSIFKKNNDFFDFVAVSDKEIQGVKNK